MAKKRFSRWRPPPSWILKICSFCHVALVAMPFCFSYKILLKSDNRSISSSSRMRVINHNFETASSSAECSRGKPPFSFVSGQDSTMSGSRHKDTVGITVAELLIAPLTMNMTNKLTTTKPWIDYNNLLECHTLNSSMFPAWKTPLTDCPRMIGSDISLSP